jgi:hypothetical protein
VARQLVAGRRSEINVEWHGLLSEFPNNRRGCRAFVSGSGRLGRGAREFLHLPKRFLSRASLRPNSSDNMSGSGNLIDRPIHRRSARPLRQTLMRLDSRRHASSSLAPPSIRSASASSMLAIFRYSMLEFFPRRYITQLPRPSINSLAQFFVAHVIEFARLATLGALNAFAG